VRYFSERVFVMYAGKIIEKAKINDLLRNPLIPTRMPCWQPPLI
jgi:ABC-type dipeptide/oligopeptide/nickel transport system ATPase component